MKHSLALVPFQLTLGASALIIAMVGGATAFILAMVVIVGLLTLPHLPYLAQLMMTATGIVSLITLDNHPVGLALVATAIMIGFIAESVSTARHDRRTAWNLWG